MVAFSGKVMAIFPKKMEKFSKNFEKILDMWLKVVYNRNTLRL